MRCRTFVFLLVGSLVSWGCDGTEAHQEETDIQEDLNEAYQELLDTEGKADGATCSGVRPPDNEPFGGAVAVTFDDGPSLTYTPRILEVLAAHGVQATFFINGKNVRTQAHWDLLERMARAGHILGNHSQNHLNSRQVDLETWREEVAATHEILRRVLEPLGRSPGYFRFPYGAANCATYSAVTDLGYHVVGWHIDSGDWCFQSRTDGYGYCSPRTFRYVPDEYRNDFVGWVVHQARRTNGGILLMHDVHGFTADHLDEVLTALEEAGFHFTTLSDTEVFPLLNGVQPPSPPWIGTPCESSEDCSFEVSGTTGYCYTYQDAGGTLQGFCSLPCAGYCPDRDGEAPTFCVDSGNGNEGMCVARAHPLNESCAAIPGTAPAETDRFVGDSTAPEATALVCLPE